MKRSLKVFFAALFMMIHADQAAAHAHADQAAVLHLAAHHNHAAHHLVCQAVDHVMEQVMAVALMADMA